MTAVLLLAGLLLCPPPGAASDAASPQLPDRPGVFAVTVGGTVELPVFGEQRKIEGAIDTFVYAASDLDRIPIVSSISSLYVNLMGWVPKDLYLIVGRKKLATPRDDYRRLDGRAYSKGPTQFEVVTRKLDTVALEQEYRRLIGKKPSGEDVRAFVVIELSSQTGLNRRSYPIQLDIQPR